MHFQQIELDWLFEIFDFVIGNIDMKKEGHPEYGFVVFKDAASDFSVLTRSSLKSKETTKWEDGNEYPVVTMEISSASHPFYTGKQKILDTAGRVEKFNRKYGMFSKKKTESSDS